MPKKLCKVLKPFYGPGNIWLEPGKGEDGRKVMLPPYAADAKERSGHVEIVGKAKPKKITRSASSARTEFKTTGETKPRAEAEARETKPAAPGSEAKEEAEEGEGEAPEAEGSDEEVTKAEALSVLQAEDFHKARSILARLNEDSSGNKATVLGRLRAAVTSGKVN